MLLLSVLSKSNLCGNIVASLEYVIRSLLIKVNSAALGISTPLRLSTPTTIVWMDMYTNVCVQDL